MRYPNQGGRNGYAPSDLHSDRIESADLRSDHKRTTDARTKDVQSKSRFIPGRAQVDPGVAAALDVVHRARLYRAVRG